MKDLTTLRLYTRVARLGSFSATAREAGLAQSQVSRAIAELEADLCTRLLSRTTRAVVPTEAGLEFLARIEPILAALDDAGNSVRQTGELRGRLRVGLPSTLATRVVLPRLRRFTEEHPALHIEVLQDDEWQDMVREVVDVGLRVGGLPDTTGTTRKIGTMRRIIVASPDYLAAHGMPERPADLHDHRIIFGPAGSRPSSWRLTLGNEQVTIDLRPHLTINDTAGALAAVTAGLGVTSTTSWACRTELDAGLLVRLLPSWETPELPVSAYFPAGRATRLSARALVDFLADALQRDPP